jgi:hypothetical protein
MNKPLLYRLDDDPEVKETRQVLSNARAAKDSGEIDEGKFKEIFDNCFSVFLRLTLGGRGEESETR